MKRFFRFVSDPGHGYLRVKLEDLVKYGVEKKISPYSFKNDKFGWLEEDIDAGTFLEAVKAAGDEPNITYVSINSDATCRRYPRFPATAEYEEFRFATYGF